MMEANQQNSKRAAGGMSNRGFSLVELLVVVAVILIIAAIAIPNFIRSKMRADEADAVQNLRTITTAEAIYSTTYEIGYSPDLATLGGNGTVSSTQAQLVDEILATGTKTGYVYSYSSVAADALGHVTAYSVNADPISQNVTGVRHFYVDQSGVIRSNETTSAGVNDQALQ